MNWFEWTAAVFFFITLFLWATESLWAEPAEEVGEVWNYLRGLEHSVWFSGKCAVGHFFKATGRKILEAIERED